MLELVHLILHLQLDLLDYLLIVGKSFHALLAAVQAEYALWRARLLSAVALAHRHLEILAHLYQVRQRFGGPLID